MPGTPARFQARVGKHLFDKIRSLTLVFSLPTLPYVTVAHHAHRTVVHCQEYYTLRHALLNCAILETYSVVSSRHLCLELPFFHVPTLFVVICVTCVYAYDCAYRYKNYRLCHTWHSIRFLFPNFPVPHFPPPAIWCRLPIFPVLHFPPLQFGADNSSPAFSSLTFSASPFRIGSCHWHLSERIAMGY